MDSRPLLLLLDFLCFLSKLIRFFREVGTSLLASVFVFKLKAHDAGVNWAFSLKWRLTCENV